MGCFTGSDGTIGDYWNPLQYFKSMSDYNPNGDSQPLSNFYF